MVGGGGGLFGGGGDAGVGTCSSMVILSALDSNAWRLSTSAKTSMHRDRMFPMGVVRASGTALVAEVVDVSRCHSSTTTCSAAMNIETKKIGRIPFWVSAIRLFCSASSGSLESAVATAHTLIPPVPPVFPGWPAPSQTEAGIEPHLGGCVHHIHNVHGHAVQFWSRDFRGSWLARVQPPRSSAASENIAAKGANCRNTKLCNVHAHAASTTCCLGLKSSSCPLPFACMCERPGCPGPGKV